MPRPAILTTGRSSFAAVPGVSVSDSEAHSTVTSSTVEGGLEEVGFRSRWINGARRADARGAARRLKQAICTSNMLLGSFTIPSEPPSSEFLLYSSTMHSLSIRLLVPQHPLMRTTKFECRSGLNRQSSLAKDSIICASTVEASTALTVQSLPRFVLPWLTESELPSPSPPSWSCKSRVSSSAATVSHSSTLGPTTFADFCSKLALPAASAALGSTTFTFAAACSVTKIQNRKATKASDARPATRIAAICTNAKRSPSLMAKIARSFRGRLEVIRRIQSRERAAASGLPRARARCPPPGPLEDGPLGATARKQPQNVASSGRRSRVRCCWGRRARAAATADGRTFHHKFHKNL